MEASHAGGAKAEVKMGDLEGSLEINPGVFGKRVTVPIAGGEGHILIGVNVVVGKMDKLGIAEGVVTENGKCCSIANFGKSCFYGRSWVPCLLNFLFIGRYILRG